MKKETLQFIAIMILALSFCFVSCSKAKPEVSGGHLCPYTHCPYKGLKSFEGVINTGETVVDEQQEGSDTYYLDMLHWEYPYASYDELEETLFYAVGESGDDASLLNDNMELLTPKVQYDRIHN